VHDVLVLHLQSGQYRPGERYLSNRALASRYKVSYQTADRLLRGLVDLGLLERRAQSGTYITGEIQSLEGVALVLHPRASRAGSFGAKLCATLSTALVEAVGSEALMIFTDENPQPPAGYLLVIWDRPSLVKQWAGQGRHMILVNEQPGLGAVSQRIDSVSTDNVAGGALAADLLRRFVVDDSMFTILAGPRNDRRATDRVDGFIARQSATVVYAEDWFCQSGFAVASEVVNTQAQAVFATNDRLAQGFVNFCVATGHRVPPIVGFDDAPVAEQLGLTTIAIPWHDLAAGVCQIVTQRLRSQAGAPVRQIYTPVPVLRSLGLT
jgi:hypothetical protein